MKLMYINGSGEMFPSRK